MNVFVLCTGRNGSLTFSKACSHIINFTSNHESRTNLIGSERVNFPNNHIEIDNRLAWFLGRLEESYGKDAFYVYLTRNRKDVVKSFLKRYNSGIMKAFSESILVNARDKYSREDICNDYYDTVNENIALFLKNKSNKMTIQLENIETDFKMFWKFINAEGDFDKALMEWKKTYNKSELSVKADKTNSKRSQPYKLMIFNIVKRIINFIVVRRNVNKIRPIHDYLSWYSSITKPLTFIQIGGCDGVINDPIHFFIKRDNWKGVIVEPQQYIFTDQLTKTYGNNNNVNLINAAIDYEDGFRDLYKIGFTSSRWAAGLSTFLREKLEANINSGYVDKIASHNNEQLPNKVEDYIAVEKVKCISFNTLLSENELNSIDLIVIDTEGFDFEIIKMIDLKGKEPKNIIYEHSSLTLEDRIACITLLIENGYSIIEENEDVLAYR